MDGKGSDSTTKETRAQQETRKYKKRTIEQIRNKITEDVFDELDCKFEGRQMPDGMTFGALVPNEEGVEVVNGTRSDKSFKTGLLMVLRQATNLLMLTYQTKLKRVVGISNLQVEPQASKLTFRINCQRDSLQVTIEDCIAQLDSKDVSYDAIETDEVIKITFDDELPEIVPNGQSSAFTNSISIQCSAKDV